MMRVGSKMASSISMAVALILAAVLLVLAFQGVNWSAMLGRLSQGNIVVLALAALMVTNSYGIRALRWRILLNAEHSVSPITTFWATNVGYLGNNFLPARAGEFLRSAFLARKTGVSTSYVLATALVERVLDVVAVVLISSIAVATLGTVPSWLVAATRLMFALAVVGLLLFFVLPRLNTPLHRLLNWTVKAHTLRTRLADLLDQALLGMRAIQNIRRACTFSLLTAAIWLMDSLVLVVVASAFDLHLALPQAILLAAALGLSSAAPSTPGYVGIYQFVAVTVLSPFGFMKEEALALILAAQATMYIVVLLWGILGLWRLSLRSAPTTSDVREPVLGAVHQ